jgi:hypothetical protein
LDTMMQQELAISTWSEEYQDLSEPTFLVQGLESMTPNSKFKRMYSWGNENINQGGRSARMAILKYLTIIHMIVIAI